jgi:multiple sugar transport system ATP-binding protein
MVAGLEEVTEGTIKIGGRVVNDVLPKDRDIAMVFQNYALYPTKTVYQNMAFGLKMRRYPRAEIKARVQEAANILGIGHLLDRKPHALSGGERQRVAVGRAIVRKPAVFLFDEPLSNLDAKLRMEMRAELSKLHQRLGTTMIYVTHDQVEAMTLGDRIAVMDRGIIKQLAEPLTLYDRPENLFVAGFIGTPPMNFVKGKLERGGQSLLFDEGTTRLPLPQEWDQKLRGSNGRQLVLGVRPEDLSVATIAAATDTPVAARVNATVNVVEPLGDEMFVYLSTGLYDLIAKVEAHHKVSVNQAVSVHIDLRKAHMFDPETGRNLTL